MESKTEFSIFDSEVNSTQLTRSNNRRKAMIIPMKKGLEMAARIQKEMET